MPLLYLVFRLFQRKYTIGVVGVIFNAEGEVLLVEHVLHPKHPWGLPGGWLDSHEQPAETIVRELREELSMSVKVEQVLLTEVTSRNHLDIAYLCRAQGEIGKISREIFGYRWIKPEDLPRIRFFHQRAIQQALRFNGIDL